MSEHIVSDNHALHGAWDSVIALEEKRHYAIPIDDNSSSILRLRPEWQSWLDQRDFVLFATLTYDKDVTPCAAERDLQHFRNRLYSKIYNKKPGGLLSFVAFLEYTKAGTPHWHVLFECISQKDRETAQQAVQRLKYLMKHVWVQMRNTPFSEAGLHTLPVYDQPGVIDYCLKSSASQKGHDFVKVEYLAQHTAGRTSVAS